MPTLAVAGAFAFTEIFVLYMASGHCLLSPRLTLQDSLEHFFQGRSNGHKFSQLLLSGSVLTFPSLLKDSFARRGILGGKFFIGPLSSGLQSS